MSELIAAGVDSIEHGTNLDTDDLAALAAAGGAWTPTLCATMAAVAASTRMRADDHEQRRAGEELRERLAHLLKTAERLGVTILTGSDVTGTIPGEVALMTDLGLSAETALAAATTTATVSGLQRPDRR